MISKHLKRILVLLSISTFVLFSLNSCENKQDKKKVDAAKPSYSDIDKDDGADTITVTEFPKEYKIVYINTDTLWEHYDFVKESKKKLEATEKQMRAQYEVKYNKMKSDYEFYMKGSQKGLLTKDQMAQKEMSLKMQEQEIMELDQKLSSQLVEKQEKLNAMVKDTIQAFLHRFRVEKGYTMIIQYGYLSALLSGDEKLDVTETATKALNKEYLLFKNKLK